MATQITALPIPPSRQDPANFAARADAFLGALPTFRTQANALAAEAETNSINATNAANSASTSASSALASRNAAEAAFDSFDDRYLGAKNANPTVDNDGQPLLTGALYFNTVVPEMRVYTGTAWVTASTVGGTVTNLTVTGTFVPPNDSITLGTHTVGSYVQRASVTGNGLSGSVNAEAANFVVNSNATATNTASTLVFRDAAGNFAAGTITANLTGTASLASNANQLNGFSSDINASANTVARRDASGFLYGVYLNQGSGNNENPSVSQVMVTNGNDGFLRKASLGHLGNQFNSIGYRFVTDTGGAPAYLAARSFIRFDSAGNVASAGNISSVSVISAGDYEVFFGNPMPDLNYTVVAMAGNSAAATPVAVANVFNLGSFRFQVRQSTSGGLSGVNFNQIAVFR